MYAVIKSGGKQYSVRVGDKVKVERLNGSVGDSVTLEDVLYVGGDEPKTGSPTVSGASVKAEVVGQGRHDYIRGFTYKPKKHQHRTFGHRQQFTELRITDINV
jgi:large subunit ribosomal protein L21